MDQQHVVALKRTFSNTPSRRDVLRGLTGFGLGLGALRWPDAAEGRSRCTRKRNKQCRRAGKKCLSNGSCAIVCAVNEDCPSTCGCSNPDIDGARHCIAGALQPYVMCTSTAKCPRGSHCQDLGFGGVCIKLCH
jgi:hypothetical protein